MRRVGLHALMVATLLVGGTAYAEDRPPTATLQVQAGNGSLWDGRGPRTAPPSLAAALDGCLAEAPAGGRLSCVSKVGRAAARQYRAKSGAQAWDSELSTTISTPALTATAFSVGHAAKDTIAGLSVLSLTPIVMDEVAAPGPRSKLYTVWATGMTLAVNRADAMNALLSAPTGSALSPDRGWDHLMAEACGEATNQAVSASLSELGGKKPSEAFTKARYAYGEAVRLRCNDLAGITRKLTAANRLWNQQSVVAAGALATDIVVLDDTVTRLDREMLAPSRSAISVIFGTIMAMPGKIAGSGAPAEFSGRSLPVFTGTYTFNLARAPDVALPEPVATPLSRPDTLSTGRLNAQLDAINSLTDQVNNALAAAAYFKAINDQSVLTIAPGSAGKPVSLAAPARP